MAIPGEKSSERTTPIFSIIVPVYNVNPDYFRQCMQSILDQSFQQLEVILVDDGSQKYCSDACDDYMRMDHRVKVIHQENQGVSAARNHGMEAATAEWIMFVDADDWLELNACELLFEYLQKTPCDMLLFNGVRDYLEYQKKLNYGFENETLFDMDDFGTKEKLYRRAMGVQNLKDTRYCVIYYSWDKVYRRDFLIGNQLKYPVGIPKSEDKVFILKCMEKMKTMYYIEKTLYHYRINSESVCHSYSENADIDRIRLSSQLVEIAKRMDRELAEKSGNSRYCGITEECNRFIFGIITDVMRLKYYHPDYPRDTKECEKEVKRFLNTQPFYEAIRANPYSKLPFNAKVKKYMLSHGMAKLFFRLKQAKK